MLLTVTFVFGLALGWCACCVVTAGLSEDAYRQGRRDQRVTDAAARIDAARLTRRPVRHRADLPDQWRVDN